MMQIQESILTSDQMEQNLTLLQQTLQDIRELNRKTQILSNSFLESEETFLKELKSLEGNANWEEAFSAAQKMRQVFSEYTEIFQTKLDSPEKLDPAPREIKQSLQNFMENLEQTPFPPEVFSTFEEMLEFLEESVQATETLEEIAPSFQQYERDFLNRLDDLEKIGPVPDALEILKGIGGAARRLPEICLEYEEAFQTKLNIFECESVIPFTLGTPPPARSSLKHCSGNKTAPYGSVLAAVPPPCRIKNPSRCRPH